MIGCRVLDDTTKPNQLSACTPGKAGLRHGRDLRHGTPACRAGDRQRDDVPGMHLRCDDRAVTEKRVDLAADQLRHAFAGAAERHMDDVDAGFALEDFDGEMRHRADAGRADGERLGMGLRVSDEFGHGLDAESGPHREHLGGAPYVDSGTTSFSTS